MADRVLNSLFGLMAILVLVSVVRSRWARRRDTEDIQPSEISPDLSAGEELLEDALRAENRVKSL